VNHASVLQSVLRAMRSLGVSSSVARDAYNAKKSGTGRVRSG
jgi:hypothetical protein